MAGVHEPMMKEKKEEGGEEEDEELPSPPDGGWGWVIVFASFMVHVIADGIAYSFGVYVEAFIEYFECTRSQIGLLGSLMLGVTWGSGLCLRLSTWHLLFPLTCIDVPCSRCLPRPAFFA